VNETHHINDIGPYGLEMEEIDMEKSFHIDQMDDKKMTWLYE
jgi:hypothetical protein